MQEIWKDIKGYEGYYKISNKGRIKSLLFQSNVWNKKYSREKILRYRGYTPKTGYRIALWKDGVAKDFLVARLAAFTFFGKDISDRKLTVNHKDGNRMNNDINNLELVSLKQNIIHGFRTGLYKNVCKKIKLVEIDTREEKVFSSMSEASRYLGRNSKFISCLLLRGRDTYKNFKIIQI